MVLYICIILFLSLLILLLIYHKKYIVFLSKYGHNERFRDICRRYLTCSSDDIYPLFSEFYNLINGRSIYIATTPSMKIIGDKCPICHEYIEIDDKIITLKCGHYAKEECIHQWLSTSITCMICRKIS